MRHNWEQKTSGCFGNIKDRSGPSFALLKQLKDKLSAKEIEIKITQHQMQNIFKDITAC